MWAPKNQYFVIKWHLLIWIMEWLEYFKWFYLAESLLFLSTPPWQIW